MSKTTREQHDGSPCKELRNLLPLFHISSFGTSNNWSSGHLHKMPSRTKCTLLKISADCKVETRLTVHCTINFLDRNEASFTFTTHPIGYKYNDIKYSDPVSSLLLIATLFQFPTWIFLNGLFLQWHFPNGVRANNRVSPLPQDNCVRYGETRSTHHGCDEIDVGVLAKGAQSILRRESTASIGAKSGTDSGRRRGVSYIRTLGVG